MQDKLPVPILCPVCGQVHTPLPEQPSQTLVGELNNKIMNINGRELSCTEDGRTFYVDHIKVAQKGYPGFNSYAASLDYWVDYLNRHTDFDPRILHPETWPNLQQNVPKPTP